MTGVLNTKLIDDRRQRFGRCSRAIFSGDGKISSACHRCALGRYWMSRLESTLDESVCHCSKLRRGAHIPCPSAPPAARPLVDRRSSIGDSAITHQLTLCTHSLRGGPIFPGSSTTPYPV